MREVTLQETREIQLNILKCFHAFCEKNCLTYYLSNGTLLGAIKYKGFIPWDDDIDVCMPRVDYERLISVYEENCDIIAGGGCYLLEKSLNKNYLFPFAKLSDDSTVLIEENSNNGVSLGVNIDIFPLDGYGNNQSDANEIYKKISTLRTKLMWAKMRPNKNDCVIKRILKQMIALKYKVVGAKKYCDKISRISKNRDFNIDSLVGNATWGFYSPNEAHEREVFAEKIEVVFEGGKFWAPQGYDKYLRKLYGEYEQDPPKEKQVTYHDYTAFYKESL